MRFFVEVATIGKPETQTSCVEADSWQKALQAARELRNEQGPISGFSIELVEDGCRAVDPLARLRYVVKRAPADAPLTAAKTSGTSAVANPARTTGPTPAAANPARTTGPTPAAANPARTTGPTPAAANPARTTGPTPAAANPARTTGPTPSAANPARTTGPVARGTTADDGTKTPSVPPASDTHVLHRRFEDASPGSQLTYREEVYALASGATEGDAEGLLLTQFGHVLRTMHGAPPGKFIHLAVFDAVFEGKPPSAPLATLVWKDWKGAEPVLAFPRRRPASTKTAAAAPVREPEKRAEAVSVHPIVNASPVAPPVAEAAPPPGIAALAEALAKASQPPPAVTPSTPPRPGPSVPPAGIAALAESLAKASQPVPAAAPVAAPVIPPNPAPILEVEPEPEPPPAAAPAAPIPLVAQKTPSVREQPAAAPAPAEPTPAPPVAIAHGVTPTPPPQHESVRQRLSSRPSSSSMAAARMRSDELIAVLFESMHDLHFARDSVEGAEFCLALLLEKLPSKGGIVHFYDMDKREFVITAASGQNIDKLLLRRHPTSDPLLSQALRQRGSVLVNDAATNDSTFVERLELLGSAKRVLVTPIMSGNRCLGAIEIMNPLDGGPYTDEEGNAIQYMAEQLAEFVGSHGLVLDPVRIQRGLTAAAAGH